MSKLSIHNNYPPVIDNGRLLGTNGLFLLIVAKTTGVVTSSKFLTASSRLHKDILRPSLPLLFLQHS